MTHPQRGYNQSERMAAGISELTAIPIVADAVRRSGFTQSQTRLSGPERRGNVSGVFELTAAGRTLEGRHVLLVDDVCTSGATLLACGEALKGLCGVRISVLTLGRTRG